MLHKNLPRSIRWKVMFVRFFMDYLAAVQMLLTGQIANFKAVFEARRAYHKMKKEYPITQDNKTNGYQQLQKRSIVWDYYVKGKRK